MKNIQIIDGATNATFSLFQATEGEFAVIFPGNQDMEIVEQFITRVGEARAGEVLAPIWQRPVLKCEAQGIHGTLFYDTGGSDERIPPTKREVDWDERWINQAQRELFRRYR
jgi:hypothetical protein